MSKLILLKNYLKKLERVGVCFSGGVDSAFLLAVAHEVLGENAVAFTARSGFSVAEESAFARDYARALGARHSVLPVTLPAACWRNTPERCYICKNAVFSAIKTRAKKEKISHIIDATHCDDAGDYRPGKKALRELNIKSPLKESGFTKKDIRRAAKRMGISVWNKPSLCCYATRFPYGEKIDPKKIKHLARVERSIKQYITGNCRVRSHGNIARVEVLPRDIMRIMRHREKIAQTAKKAGFTYITLDLEGYRSGSMNEEL